MNEIGTIFIIEDSEIDTWIAKKVLGFAGLGKDYICCGDGEEALQKLSDFAYVHRSLPELILVDIGLPVCDGIDLIRKIRQLPTFSKKHNLIVLMTEGLDSKFDLPRLQTYNIRYVVFKPLNKEKLLEVISEFKKDCGS